MIIVSDTTSLNYLVLIGHADMLRGLFGAVYTAPGVIEELSHDRAPNMVRAWAAAPPSWLVVQQPKAILPNLRLGKRESQAISLAKELGATAVLIDDERARRTAERVGLSVQGTLGVLLLGAEAGLIDLTDALDRLGGTLFRAPAGRLEELRTRARDQRERSN